MALRPIYYDTETTGVRSDTDRIIEIAAYDPVQNRSFVKLINPCCPIPAEASAIHHITNEMVASAPIFAEVGREFVDFCQGDIVLIAHNNDSFDRPFLAQEFQRHGLSFPDWLFIDSLKWARRYRPDLPRHSLQFLRETYGITANNAHRALDDVMVLYQIFSFLVDDLPFEKILELMSKSSKLVNMPFGKYQGKPLKEIPRDYVAWLQKSGSFDKAENKELRASFEALGLLETTLAHATS